MHTRRLAFVFALVAGVASSCLAAPVIVEVNGSSATPATGQFTFPGGNTGTFNVGNAISSLNTTGSVSVGTAAANFTPFVFSNPTTTADAVMYQIGNVTKTLDFGNNITATFSLTNLVATINNNTMATPNAASFINVVGTEVLTGNGNAANFDLTPFLNSGVFTLTLTRSGENFQTDLANGRSPITGQGSQFTQNAAGTGPGPVVPEPGTLALWTSLAAAAFFIRRRRSR